MAGRLHWARPTETLTGRRSRGCWPRSGRSCWRRWPPGHLLRRLYINVNGESGYFDRSLAVYGREDRPCPRCGSPVRRDSFMNRSASPAPGASRARGTGGGDEVAATEAAAGAIRLPADRLVQGRVQGVGSRWVRSQGSGRGWRERRGTCPTAGSRGSPRGASLLSRTLVLLTGPGPRAGSPAVTTNGSCRAVNFPDLRSDNDTARSTTGETAPVDLTSSRVGGPLMC